MYLIRNLINGKVYVGQTKCLTNRKLAHLSTARAGDQRPLYASIRKHGAENFAFEVLEECDDSLADEREQHWVTHFDSFNPEKGYNLTSGGVAATKVRVFEKRCQKLRKESNPERGTKISARLTGRKLSEEHKRATSEGVKRYLAQRGKWHVSDETRSKMSAVQKVARAKRAIMVSPTDPRASNKMCSICGNVFGPKTLRPSDVNRHQVKRWCSRRCALIAHNRGEI